MGLDPSRFGGRPHLTIRRQDGNVHLALTNATYPGTQVPADFTADIALQKSNSRMYFQMAFGSFAADIELVPWLAGQEPAKSRVQVAHRICALGDSGCVDISGAPMAEFSPDWTLRLAGAGVGQVAGLGPDLQSDGLRITLLGPLAPSILRQPSAKRSLISIDRGKAPWTLMPAVESKGWRLFAVGSPFDALHVETGESKGGHARRALVAEGAGGAPRLFFQPGDDFQGSDGKPFALPLVAPHYAVSFDPAGDQALLTAGYGPSGTWLQNGIVSLQLGDGPGATPFCLVDDGRGVALECQPAVRQAAAPLAGTYTRVNIPPKAVAAFSLPSGTTVKMPTNLDPSRVPIGGPVPPPAPTAAKNLTLSGFSVSSVTVLRPADMLNLTFDFTNLILDPGFSELRRADMSKPAYITVTFPPQHIAEEASEEGKQKEPAVQSRIAGPSKLVFALPADVATVPYTLPALLAWRDLVSSIAPKALPPQLNDTSNLPFIPDIGGPRALDNLMVASTPPGPLHTALEVPYRLILSPNNFAAWANATEPVTHNGRTELWHTRLGVRGATRGTVSERRADLRTVRAIWAKDMDAGSQPEPFMTALTARQRMDLVGVTTDFVNMPDDSVPIETDQLMLSGLGAWLKMRGNWEPNAVLGAGYSVSGWRHTAVMGRDQYVLVVEEGYLFPFGHRAAKITVSERQFKISPNTGAQVAYLIQKESVVVRQSEMDFTTGLVPFDNSGRELPFQRVRLVTLQSPNIDIAAPGDPNQVAGVTWIAVNKVPFLFQVEAQDVAGAWSTFGTELAFVAGPPLPGHKGRSATAGTSADSILQLIGKWQNRPGVELLGQKVALAPSRRSGDTSFDTVRLWFSAHSAFDQFAQVRAGFYPVLAKADIRMEALARMTGQAGNVVGVEIATEYLTNGFDSGKNVGQIFIKLRQADAKLESALKDAQDKVKSAQALVDKALTDLEAQRQAVLAKYEKTIEEWTNLEQTVKDKVNGELKPYLDKVTNLKSDLDTKLNTMADKAKSYPLVKLPSAMGGGVVDLNMAVTGLSRSWGMVSGPLGNLSQGSFDPTVYLPADAVLFGNVRLRDLIPMGDLKDLLQKAQAEAQDVLGNMEAQGNDVKDAVLDLVDDTRAKALGLVQDAKTQIRDLQNQAQSAIDGVKNQAKQTLEDLESAALGVAAPAIEAIQSIEDLVNMGDSPLNSWKSAVPSLQCRLVKDAMGIPTAIKTMISWSTSLKTVDLSPVLVVTPAEGTKLGLYALLLIPLDGGASDYTAKVTVGSVTIGICEVISMELRSFAVTQQKGQKLKFDHKFGKFDFSGVMSFVTALQAPMEALGLGNVKIDAGSDGVTALTTLGPLSIQIGMMSLQDIALRFGVEIPFVKGKALSFSFDFSTPKDPATITVGPLGGTAYFGIVLSTDSNQGIVRLVAALEFGAIVKMSFGSVASGSVKVAVGIYFQMNEKSVLLTGYLACEGSVRVLGLVTISIIFNMGLTYSDGGVKGYVKVKVNVHTCLFDKSVTLEMERKFAGSPGDPTFGEIMAPSDWNDYCDAFAS